MGVVVFIGFSSDIGFFWFFDEVNVEFVVKIFDGCGINDCYWVFVGGLMDVCIEIYVCDFMIG